MKTSMELLKDVYKMSKFIHPELEDFDNDWGEKLIKVVTDNRRKNYTEVVRIVKENDQMKYNDYFLELAVVSLMSRLPY